MEQRDIRRFNLVFSECRYLGEIYAHIKDELELPQWSGENLDALWDAVTGMMYTPAEIIICPKVRGRELQDDIQKIVAVFQEAQQEYNVISANVLGDTD